LNTVLHNSVTATKKYIEGVGVGEGLLEKSFCRYVRMT